MSKEQLFGEIKSVKRQLERTAERYHYNLQHPCVICMSQKLDNLIVSYMKQHCS
jgi:electron transfer flavoprotein alpha/beta subunit